MTLWKRFSLLLGLLVAVASLATLGTGPAFAAHFPWDQAHDTFRPDQGDDGDPGDDGPNECGSPVEVASGNYVFSTQLLLVAGRGPDLNVTLTYNSHDLRNGPFGAGWVQAFDQRLVETTDTVQVYAICSQAGGKRERYVSNSTGTFTPPAHVQTGLARTTAGSGGFELKDKDGTIRRFTAEGRLSAMVDRHGSALSFTYDSTGFMTRMTDAVGRSVDFIKGANGRVASVQDPAGRIFRFDYDSAGNLIRITNPGGDATRFQYGGRNNLTAVIDARNNTQIALTYDTLGRVGTLRQRAETWTFSYNPALRRTVKTDSGGRAWTFEYTETGNITRITDPTGGVERLVYDGNFNLVEVFNPLGGRKAASYDSRGNPLTVTDALGNVRRLTYDPTFNRLASIQNALGQTTRFEYDAVGNMVRSINALGQTTIYEYDGFGQMTRTTDPEGNSATLAYDSYGNLVEMVDPLGNRSTATYDLLGKVLSTSDPDGRTIRHQYDLNERLLKTTASDGGETTYTYDAVGNLLALYTASGGQTTYEYDIHDRLTKVTNPLGQITTFAYDKHDNVVSSTDPKGQTVTFQFDNLDRLTRKIKPDDTVVYTYDRAGNVLTAVDGDSSLTFVYDLLNRLTEVRTAGAAQPATTVRYTYSAEGTRNTMTDPAGGVTTYQYDLLTRPVRITDPAGNAYTFGYDSLSRRVQMTQGNGLTTDYTYDSASRLTTLRHTGSPSDLLFGYTYDGNANRLTVTDMDGVHSYGYDLANRLMTAAHPGTLPAESYAYDSVGNRTNSHLAAGYTYDQGNRLTTDGVFAYIYDANGNMTRKTETATGLATVYSYDSENRIIRIDLPGGGAATYAYDAMGRRIRKDVNGTVTQYVYDEVDILFEYVNGTVSARYTHGPAIDEVLGVSRGGSFAFFQSDSLGTIRRVVDGAGTVLASYTYDSFGRILGQTGTPQGPYLFQGREYDAESGLYFFRARYYDPQVGRFVNEDPMGHSAGPNFYAFADNNPIGLTDPFGLEVGFWESLIPVWGSGKQAYEDFACGRWGWGIANTLLAASDVFLVKALVTGVAKGVFKTGLKSGMSRANPAFPRGTEWVEQSHWIPKRYLPESLQSAGWNLKPMWGTDHALADPFRYRFMPRPWKAQNPMPNPAVQQWNRIPDGVKGAGAGGASAGGRAANGARDRDCNCN